MNGLGRWSTQRTGGDFGSPVDQCWKLTWSGIMERISRLGREGERLHSPGALPQRDFYWPEVYL